MRCPYCISNETCEHHLLSVDVGERQACGGALYELFNARLQGLQRSMDPDDFEEADGFIDQRLAEVEGLAGHGNSDMAGGLAPGFIEDFYCPTAMEVDMAVDLYAVRYGLLVKH